MSSVAQQLMLGYGWRLPVAGIVLNNVTSDNIINSAEAAGSISITGSVSGDVVVGDTVTVISNSINYTGPVVAGMVFSISVPGSSLVADPYAIVQANVTATLYGNSITVGTSKGYTVSIGAPSVAVDIIDTSLTFVDSVSLVTFTFSEAPVGFAIGDISTSNGVISTLVSTGNPLIYNATFTASASFVGTGTVSVIGGSYTNSVGSPGSAGSDTVSINTIPLGINWWLEGYTFGGSLAQMSMQTGEQTMTGNAIVTGTTPTGYAAILRDDTGGISGTQNEFSTTGVSYAYGENPYMTSGGDLIMGVRAATGTNSVTIWNKHSSNEVIAWTKFISVPDTTQSRPPAFAVHTDGSIYLLNQPSFNTSVGRAQVIKLNSSGVQQWVMQGGATLETYSNSGITLDSSGNVYTCCRSNYLILPPPRYGISVSKYNSAGTMQWDFQYSVIDNYPLPSYRFGFPNGFVVDSSTGDVYVVTTGESSTTSDGYVYVLKLNSSGVVQWCKEVLHPATPYVYAGEMVLCGTDIVFGITADATNYLVRMTSAGAIVRSITIQVGTWPLFKINSAKIVGDGNGNLVVSSMGSNYSGSGPFTVVGFTTKFPDSLTKTGSWSLASGLTLTTATSSAPYSTNLPDTIISDNTGGGGTGWATVSDGTGTFTMTSTTVTTDLVVIP